MVHLGIEIASSPLPTINDLGPTVTISDFGNNHGLVIGPAIADWRGADIADWPVSRLINGREAGAPRAAEVRDGPFGAARFQFELIAQRGIARQRGSWPSSGPVTDAPRGSVGGEGGIGGG